ncbi:MAG: FAD-binding protein [Silvanigrellales bacterium]|jgi:hypothetical protein|nr:FAD-binding protein [Silvanigrellales bacterium]
MILYDLIVVGGGPAGISAARGAAEKGARCLLVEPASHTRSVPARADEQSFVSMRFTDPSQEKVLLGPDFEALRFTDAKLAQLSPQRIGLADGVESLLPMEPSRFARVESLQAGGLGSAWGLGCYGFTKKELLAAGLHFLVDGEAIGAVAKNIGVTKPEGALAPYLSGLVTHFSAALPVDRNAEFLLSRYRSRAARGHTECIMGTPMLALGGSTDGDFSGYRPPSRLREMEFYDDDGGASWRPQMDLRILNTKERFERLQGHMVLRLRESDGRVEADCFDISTRESRTVAARKAVLCAGALGSARVAAASHPSHRTERFFRCQPYSYLVGLVPSLLGESDIKRRVHALCQFQFARLREGGQEAAFIGSGYSYRSLLNFRLLSSSPLGFRNAMNWWRCVAPALVIVGLHEPDDAEPQLRISFPCGGDHRVNASQFPAMKITSSEPLGCAVNASSASRFLRGLGWYPLLKRRLPPGSGTHYSGTLASGICASDNGILNGFEHVRVGDAAFFSRIPAKGLTLTIMAYARYAALASLENITR